MRKVVVLLTAFALIAIVFAGGVLSSSITGYQPLANPQTYLGDSQQFSISANESTNITWYVNGTLDSSASETNKTTSTYSNATLKNTVGIHNITAAVNNSNGTDTHTWMWTVSYSPPQLSGKSPNSPVSTGPGQSITFNIGADQNVNFEWYVDDGTSNTSVQNNTSTTTASYTPPSSYTDNTGSYTVHVLATNTTTGLTQSESWDWTVSYLSLQLSGKSPSSPHTTTSGDSVTFSINANQNVNFEWYVDDGTSNTSVQSNTSATTASYTPSSTYTDSTGDYTVLVYATNATSGLTQSESWAWKVASSTYYTGDSVWRDGEDSDTYTWTTQSFAGFYYNIDENVGTEQLVFNNIDAAGRVVSSGDIVYTTTSSAVSYNYSAWGTYEVIGFMAEKYFAGYLNSPSGTGTEKPLSRGNLHR
ncbi:MAG: S-layer protein domain-containing protein, partial [Methermicoccaceae archaeon]